MLLLAHKSARLQLIMCFSLGNLLPRIGGCRLNLAKLSVGEARCNG